jgi:Ion channel
VNAPKPELRLASLLGRRALTPRRAATIIGAYTLGITLAGGVLARIVDPRDFDSLGTSLWWALQTVTTVGYGDVVPRSVGGRAIGAVVMLSGIGFLTVVTASVTAALIEGVRDRTPWRRQAPVRLALCRGDQRPARRDRSPARGTRRARSRLLGSCVARPSRGWGVRGGERPEPPNTTRRVGPPRIVL